MSPELTEPWGSFLADVDARVRHDVQLHCCGGFVVTPEHVAMQLTGHKTRSVFDRYNIVSESELKAGRRSTRGVREEATERNDR